MLSKHPQPRTQTKKRTSVVATGSPKQSDLPCAMVYGLFRALLGDRAFLPPSPANCFTDLTPASGRQDHTALPSASTPLVLRCRRVHRIPPNVRDDGQRPSYRGETGEVLEVILPDELSEIFLARGLDDPNQHDSVEQIRFCAHGIFELSASTPNDVEEKSDGFVSPGQINHAS